MTTRSTSADRLAGIAQIITATAEVLGHEITPAAVEMMALDLAEYPDQQIADGLKACRRELTGRLTLAAIIDRIQRTDGHPEPNEAWAIALQASDERSTVVMTEQMQKALIASQPIIDSGDAVGARMAFLDAYRRLVAEARDKRRETVWFASLGWDVQGRAAAISRAMEMGRIGKEQGDRLLLQHKMPEASQDSAGFAVAGLIAGKPSAQPSNEESRKRIAELRAVMQKNAAERLAKEEQEKEAQAKYLAEKRESVKRAITELQEVRHA